MLIALPAVTATCLVLSDIRQTLLLLLMMMMTMMMWLGRITKFPFTLANKSSSWS